MSVQTEPLAQKSGERAARRNSGWKSLRKNWELYLFVLPTVAYFIIFHYFPMYGLQIAFRDYTPSLGIWNSPWVGLEHLKRFFDSYYFWTLIKNTIGISVYELVVGFPIPIVLALALNELRNGAFKKWGQTVTYAPHFISAVVMAGMVIAFLSPGTGIINLVIKGLGGDPIQFLTEPGWFKTVFVMSGVWQNMGWGTIIYLAALAGVDPQQHEAAMMDGATRLQRVWHINLPSIVPTMIILLILNVGSFMSVGFEKVFLLQNPLNLQSSDVISTYIYRSGLVQGQFSFSAAIGLFNSVINFILLVIVNRIAKRVNETSLW
ncbi:ABC transporter permease [Paenibacillus contaminans]|uniref:Sugar ABC transporter permease n=1 Tax=Paenibacillus contaminans TaxID=450362 RepID=A0A329M5E9_9BACL|nr:sugar ABC transporter permease [Paenibacillus contaminans]RAV14406.1 sugar ABC transporter permease [Paenibacillus contaminans]